jgi:CheY-like chemotaxis protein
MAPGRTGLIGLLENDPNILEAAVQLLTHHGYRALAARDTGELMQALADEHRTAPDLLISDFHLGIDQDGLQLIEGLRRQPAWRETVFILVTGDLDASVAARAAAAQVALAYKPLQPRRLLQLVDRLLAQRSLAA